MDKVNSGHFRFAMVLKAGILVSLSQENYLPIVFLEIMACIVWVSSIMIPLTPGIA